MSLPLICPVAPLSCQAAPRVWAFLQASQSFYLRALSSMALTRCRPPCGGRLDMGWANASMHITDSRLSPLPSIGRVSSHGQSWRKRFATAPLRELHPLLVVDPTRLGYFPGQKRAARPGSSLQMHGNAGMKPLWHFRTSWRRFIQQLELLAAISGDAVHGSSVLFYYKVPFLPFYSAEYHTAQLNHIFPY